MSVKEPVLDPAVRDRQTACPCRGRAVTDAVMPVELPPAPRHDTGLPALPRLKCSFAVSCCLI